MKTATLEERKKISYDILCEFDSICRENHITYYLAYGTLIGAVRHKGFIPWDDDIDVMVPIEDIERLYCILEEKSKYKLINHFKEKNWVWFFSKLYDDRTEDVFVDPNSYEGKQKRHGQAIDIFPIAKFDGEHDVCVKRLKKCAGMVYRQFMYNHGYYRGNLLASTYCFALKLIKKDILYYKNKLLKLEKKCISGTYCGDPLDVFGVKAEMNPISDFEICELQFEDNLFYAPKGYDGVLSRVYGNYMKLPPKEKQISNHLDYKTIWRD